MVGAEMPMTSDQVIWSEQNRLHVAYKGLANPITVTGAALTYEIEVEPDISWNWIRWCCSN
jgi:hypothetical protein